MKQDMLHVAIVATIKCDYVEKFVTFDLNDVSCDNYQKQRKNDSHEIAHVIWSLDKLMRKSLRCYMILGGYDINNY